MAIAALALVPVVAIGCSDDGETAATTTAETAPPTTAAPTTVPPGEQIFIFSLTPGDCFDIRVVTDEEGDESDTIFKVDCTLPHDNEIYDVVTHTAGRGEDYPGDDELAQYANRECISRFTAWSGIAYELSKLDVGFVAPTLEEWVGNDRTITCYAYDMDGAKLTAPMRGSGT